MSLKKGETVPSVKLKDKDGKVFNTDYFKGDKAFVIYFSPKIRKHLRKNFGTIKNFEYI